MKGIAFSLAALALSAGAAFAAAPAQTGAPAQKSPVTDLRNAPDAKRMTEALNLLEAKGYGAFNDFKADGQGYSAAVTQNGHPVTVVVNPDSGQVTPQG